MQLHQEGRPIFPSAPLQLLLFVDTRPKSRQQVQRIRSCLKELQADHEFELSIIDVGQEPYLAEHYKLVATPALVKIHPLPIQTLTGTNITLQLRTWWSRWQNSVEAYLEEQAIDSSNPKDFNQNPMDDQRSIAASAESMRLKDEIFRLKQEKEKLKEQLQFKDRVIGMLVHDLRNPLTAAGIAIDTLQYNYNPDTGEFNRRLKPGMTVHLLKQARNQTRILDRMINDLLQVGQDGDTELKIVPERMNLGKLSVEVIQELSDRYNAKSQKIQTDIPEDLPPVYADPERVRQVLVNLLDNAIKYTPLDGCISISAIHRTTQKVQFSIGDNGPGIPEENRERIFESGYRLQRDKQIDGYGIGLSLCQRIIRAHYGQIWVDSYLNGGAWFHFTLPVYHP
jgi:two-component system, OmpR family, clock-associated histidine kinase SasA